MADNTKIEYTFCKECVLMNVPKKNDITDRITKEVTGSWFTVSLSDGSGFQLMDVTINKEAEPEKLAAFQRVKAYFVVKQKPNKNGNGFLFDVRIVKVDKV